jgi:hypothetical protein
MTDLSAAGPGDQQHQQQQQQQQTAAGASGGGPTNGSGTGGSLQQLSNGHAPYPDNHPVDLSSPRPHDTLDNGSPYHRDRRSADQYKQNGIDSGEYHLCDAWF